MASYAVPDKFPQVPRGRFAPSPTGDLHLGSAIAALFAFAFARRAGGEIVLRVEDLDTPRLVPGAEDRIAADLGWLGLTFDASPGTGGPSAPYRQSERKQIYAAAIDALSARGRIFACDCSRSDIARAASAPHAGDDGPRYPGTCRDRPRDAPPRRPQAMRFRSDGAASVYQDGALGAVAVPPGAIDDFVLRRGDGVFSYQLACAVDDAAMGITEVVRGADLRGSAPRQAALLRALDVDPPVYTHVPLLVEDDGARLAKRRQSASLASLRARGIPPDALIRALAAAYDHPLASGGDALAQLSEVADARKFSSDVVTIGRVDAALRDAGISLESR